MKNIFLISGVPCCLKTKFGDWLRDNRGFFHIDVESPNFIAGPFHYLWSHSVPDDIRVLVRALTSLHPRIVLTWGFPISRLEWVPRFQDAGIETLWFDGDVDTARRNWIGRKGREPQGKEQQQFEDIKARHAEILSVYGQRNLETLSGTGVYLKLPTIAERLGIAPYP